MGATLLFSLVKHDFKGDSEIDAILREKPAGQKSAFIKAAIKSYVETSQPAKPIPTVRIQV